MFTANFPRVAGLQRAVGLRSSLWWIICWIALVTYASLHELCGSDRVALVIGNDSYPPEKVGNTIVKWDLNGIPVEDARRMADLLHTKLGFDVDVGENLKYPEMVDKLKLFKQQVVSAKVALFYYSGHGAESNGENFLVPVDNLFLSATNKTINLSTDVIDLLDSAGDDVTKIVLLDACRNDPFKSLSKGADAGEAKGGLAMPRNSSGQYPQGMIIGYAASPGHKAATGKGPTSVYTTSLLKFLAEPGLEFEEILKKAGADVKQVTNKGQVPWRNSNADDVPLVLLPGKKTQTTPAGEGQEVQPIAAGIEATAKSFAGQYELDSVMTNIPSYVGIDPDDLLEQGLNLTVDKAAKSFHLAGKIRASHSKVLIDVELPIRVGKWNKGGTLMPRRRQ
jgi:uncharacterized caspase-like protein